MQFIWLPDLLSSFLWLYLLNGRTVISQLLLKSGKISDSLRLKSIIYLTYRIFHFHSFGLLFLPYLLYWILWSCYVFTSLSPSAVCALLEVMQELVVSLLASLSTVITILLMNCMSGVPLSHSLGRPWLWDWTFSEASFHLKLHISFIFALEFCASGFGFLVDFFFSYFNPFSGSVTIIKSCLAVLGWGAISLI